MNIEPIRPTFKLEVLSPEQLAEIKAATLHILEHVGVKFPSEHALRVFAEHGANVDPDRQIVRMPTDLVIETMGYAPRTYVLSGRADLDQRLDAVMEGWRLTRLPRIDRDILRLAAVDIEQFNTPAPVACNEAVELANRYSDEQGRRMINGVLRRFTNAPAKS